jgi:hypothetical protein
MEFSKDTVFPSHWRSIYKEMIMSKLTNAVQGWLVGFAIVLGNSSSLAQGTFQNLGFESANVSGYSQGSAVPIGQALPGWTGYSGGVLQAAVLYDTISISGVDIVLIDGSAPNGTVIEGNYSAVLQGGDLIGGGISTISQTGFVPTDSLSIQLKISTSPSNPFTVSLGGQSLAITPILVAANYTLYQADVSGFAGKSAELAISALPGNHYLAVDSIEFSPAAVPEPSAICLLALGLLGLGWQSHRKR